MKDSTVSDHLLQCNCTIDFDHFDVLANDFNKFNLLVKESLLIKRDNLVLIRTTKLFHFRIIRVVLLPFCPSLISNLIIIIL